VAAERETGAPQTLGTFIRSQRRLAALSLRQLANMTSVSNAYLSQVERGIHQPSLRVLRSLAGALDISVDQLVERAGGDAASLTSAASAAATAPTTAAAIQLDPELTEADKRLLLDMYTRLRGKSC
jgi:transcriptional regulator with XRE-family HTH domain